MNKTGVTVGSADTNFCELFSNPYALYFLGLWCADGYHRTSSIGLSNVNKSLILAFKEFLSKLFSQERLRLRIYLPIMLNKERISSFSKETGINKISYCSIKKATVPTIHVYVNSRPLLRAFRKAREKIEEVKDSELLKAYFAGRFDGDGSISSDFRSDCRIAYSNLKEAQMDCDLLSELNLKLSKVYRYKKAGTYCIYISRLEAYKFIENIRKYSRTQKLVSVPSRDLIATRTSDQMAMLQLP